MAGLLDQARVAVTDYSTLDTAVNVFRANDPNIAAAFDQVEAILKTVAPATPPPPPPTPSPSRWWGTTMSVHLVDSTRQREIDDALAVGMNCYRPDAELSIGDLAHQQGIRVLAPIFSGNSTVPDIPTLANTMIAYAKRYPDCEVLLEPKNEPNFGMTVAQVAAIHTGVYPIIKAAGLTNAKVLLSSIGNGASSIEHLSPRDWAYGLAARGCVPGHGFDIGNYHAYAVNPAIYDQWMGVRTADSSGRSIQAAFGHPPYLMTEYGQALSGVGGNETTQAQAVSAWMQWCKADPLCLGGMVYALSDDAPGSGTGYGLRRHDLTHRPSWDSFHTQATSP